LFVSRGSKRKKKLRVSGDNCRDSCERTGNNRNEKTLWELQLVSSRRTILIY